MQHLAAENGHIAIAKELLKHGSAHDLLQLDFKNRDENAPSHYACKNGHLGMVKLLLENGASENIDMISTALYHATKLEHNLFEIVGELLKYGAIIDYDLPNGDWILSYSWVNEYKDTLKFSH